MKVLCKTLGMSKQRWLELRSNYIGGSDAAVIMGASKFKSIRELWEEKVGLKEISVEETELTHFGHLMEPIIIKEYSQRFNQPVKRRNAILQSSEYPWMIANVDGFIYSPTGKIVFEAKNVSEFAKEEWFPDKVPEAYFWQVQQYLCVCEDAEYAVVCAVLGGNRMITRKIHRDPDAIAALIEAEERFYKENVLKKIPPEIDGKKVTSEYLSKKYPKANDTEIELPEEAGNLLEEYDAVQEQINKLSEKKEYITNSIKNLLGENERGRYQSRLIKWKNVSVNRFNSKKFQAENPEIHKQYVETSSYRKLSIA